MQVFTYSEARQKLSSVLDKAEKSGKVLIRRKDGRTFALVPEPAVASPLDVPWIKAQVTTEEIISILRKQRGRKTAATRFLENRRKSISIEE